MTGWRVWADVDADGFLVSPAWRRSGGVAHDFAAGEVTATGRALAEFLPGSFGLYMWVGVDDAIRCVDNCGDKVLAEVAPIGGARRDPMDPHRSYVAPSLRIVRAFVAPDRIDRWRFASPRPVPMTPKTLDAFRADAFRAGASLAARCGEPAAPRPGPTAPVGRRTGARAQLDSVGVAHREAPEDLWPFGCGVTAGWSSVPTPGGSRHASRS